MDSINSFLDLPKICRLCIKQQEPLFKIFTEDENPDLPTSIASKIIACVSIEIEPGDGLPDQICNICLEKLENWISFKSLCDNTNSILHRYVTGISPIPDEVLQKNLQACSNENWNIIPNTPSDFRFEDVSLFEEDSQSQPTHNDKDSTPVILSSENKSFSKALGLEDNSEAPEDNYAESQEQEVKNEAQRAKWRDKFNRIYRNKYNCGLCEKVYTKYSQLLEHDRMEHKELIFDQVCCLCELTFVSEYRLALHQEVKHKEKLYECDICGLKSVSKKSLQVHKHRHTNRFVCDVCGVAKSSALSLDDHRRTHNEDKLVTCNKCNKSFKHRQSLEHHLRTHISDTLCIFQCNVCLKQCKTDVLWKIHKTTHDTKDVTVCDVCGKCLKNKQTLYIHKLNHKEKKHVCLVCDKVFSTRNLLKRHLGTHGAPQYACAHCNKSFNRADTLKGHLKTHTELTTTPQFG